MDPTLELLALCVDERVRQLPPYPEPGRLYGVTTAAGGEVDLQLLARGEPREIPRCVRPPAGLAAIALATHGWMAPWPEGCDEPVRPSRHPDRVRVSITALVTGDGLDVTVVRRVGQDDVDPLVLTGDAGFVNQLMVRCWSRRADARTATRSRSRGSRGASR